MLKLEELGCSMGGVLRNDNTRKMLYARTNTSRDRARDNVTSNVRAEMLETQLKTKDSEIERLKLSLDEEREKRRKSDSEKRTIIKQIQ